MKSRLLLIAAIIFAVSAVTTISFAQRTRDNSDKPIAGDFKVTVKTTIAGQSRAGTTLIKGQRERDETTMAMGGGMNISQINITQCDLKRTIQINDSARKYMITPMESDDSASAGGPGPATAGGTSRRGGVVTLTTNTIDTGERREMFGFTARHLRRTTMMESSPDACQQTRMKIETDGWYINLEYGLSCGGSDRPSQMGRTTPQGCRDRYQSRRTGPANLGFALIETTTMYGDDGRAMFTSSKEVVELSRQPLDAALFEVPAGYTEASSQQEMSGAPSMASIMAMQNQQQTAETHAGSGQTSMPSTPANAIAPSRARVGVVEFNNKTKSTLSTDSLREQLIAMLKGNGIDAVSLNASSPSEAAIEAKAKECTYVLYTDISTLKAASSGKRIGGLLGRAAGVSSGEAGKSEARLDFRLTPTGSSTPTVQSSASSKEDSDQASVSAAIESEAKAVASAVGKT